MRSSRTLRALLVSLTACLFAPLARAQTFAQPTVIPTGNWPAAVYTADINNDGFPDLIYIDGGATSQASTTHVLLNDGKGNFTQSATLATAGGSVAIGDLTGTGHIDVGWLTWTQTSVAGAAIHATVALTVAPNRGDGTFSASQTTTFPTIVRSPSQFSYLTVAPFHHKAPLDVLAQDSANNLIYAFQPAHGKTDSSDYSFANLPDGVGPSTIADLNGDGHFDLVVNSVAGASAQVYLLDPTPSTIGFGNVVQPTSILHGLSGIHSLLIQDVNYDGIPDLIAEGAQGHIDVFPGNGDGTFQTTSIGGTGPLDGTTGNGGHLIVAADLNGDNLLDALTITPAGVSTLLGNGTAYLGLNGIYNAGPTGANGHPSYVTADFNHDGTLDLAVDSPEGIAILFGNKDGTFQTSRAFAAGAPAQSAALGAFTASGHTDAIVSINSAQAQLLLGQSDGTFIAAPAPTTTQPGPTGLWSNILVGDFNRDGNLDLALTADGAPASLPTTGTGLVVQYGDGHGNFASPTAPSNVVVTTSCASHPAPFYGTSILADFNSDTFLDLANRDFNSFTEFNASTSTPIGVYSEDIRYSPCAAYPHNLLAAGDFTGDSIPDVFVESDGHLSLHQGHGNGGFMDLGGDLANDGSYTTPGQLTAPILSDTFNGPAVSKASGGLGFPAQIGSTAVTDLDRDGNQDLLITYANLAANPQSPTFSAPNYLYIWFGSGYGQFHTSTAHPVNPVRIQLSRNYYQVALADLNRDGIPDLILSDGYLLSVQLGVGDGTFGPETHYLAGQGINTVSVGDVNGDGVPDLILANGGAVLTNPVANHETLAANPDVNTGGITVLLNQTPQATPLAPTSLTLALCVDDPGSLFPCGVPLTATPLVSPVTMYYGQVLDGVASESATNLGGTITFYDGTRVFCTIPANLTGAGPSGNACPTNAGNFHAGDRTVDAVYSGDSTHAGSTSNSIQVKVFRDITTAAIASSLNLATAGQAVTFTATVTGNFATPTGTVTFFDLLTPIGTATLDATGNATFTTSTLAVGSHPITVAYSGTPDFNPAPIAILTQVILPPAVPPPPTPPPGTFTLTVAPTPLTVTVGRTGLLLVTVTANGSFAQPVALTCATSALESSCDFILPTIPAGGGSTTFELHTTAPHDCGDPNHPYFAGSCTPSPSLPATHPNPTLTQRTALLLPALLFFGFGFKQARRRLRNRLAPLTLLLLLALTGLTILSGCGVCTDLGTQGGRYTFTITASAQGGPVTETQSQTIPLTVIIP